MKTKHLKEYRGGSSGNVESYEMLAAAIVESACRDYIHWYRALAKSARKKTREEAEAQLHALVRFFHSDWYGVLCDIGPDRLISMLEDEASTGTRRFWVASNEG